MQRLILDLLLGYVHVFRYPLLGPDDTHSSQYTCPLKRCLLAVLLLKVSLASEGLELLVYSRTSMARTPLGP